LQEFPAPLPGRVRLLQPGYSIDDSTPNLLVGSKPVAKPSPQSAVGTVLN